MILPTCTVTFQASCDRCGKTHPTSCDNHPDAYAAAVADGWLLSNWVDEGCPRQTLFCQACAVILTLEVGEV